MLQAITACIKKNVLDVPISLRCRLFLGRVRGSMCPHVWTAAHYIVRLFILCIRAAKARTISMSPNKTHSYQLLTDIVSNGNIGKYIYNNMSVYCSLAFSAIDNSANKIVYPSTQPTEIPIIIMLSTRFFVGSMFAVWHKIKQVSTL